MKWNGMEWNEKCKIFRHLASFLPTNMTTGRYVSIWRGFPTSGLWL